MSLKSLASSIITITLTNLTIKTRKTFKNRILNENKTLPWNCQNVYPSRAPDETRGTYNSEYLYTYNNFYTTRFVDQYRPPHGLFPRAFTPILNARLIYPA